MVIAIKCLLYFNFKLRYMICDRGYTRKLHLIAINPVVASKIKQNMHYPSTLIWYHWVLGSLRHLRLNNILAYFYVYNFHVTPMICTSEICCQKWIICSQKWSVFGLSYCITSLIKLEELLNSHSGWYSAGRVGWCWFRARTGTGFWNYPG